MNLKVEPFIRSDVYVLLLGAEKPETFLDLVPDASLLNVTGFSWDEDLSPWYAPKVFRKGNDFAGHGEAFLQELQNTVFPLLKDAHRTVIAGYSLAGLFALWAAGCTDAFDGAVSASGSLWFPGFTDWLREHPLNASAVYLSLGDKEPLAKNPLMASVGQCTEQVYETVKGYAQACFEWNEGNHFMQADERLAKGIRWTVEHLK